MDKDNVIRLLKAYSKKTIQKSELENLFNPKSDEELFNMICENRELLQPIVSSKTNGNRKYPIYMKYKIFLPEQEQQDYSDEIRKLHPMLQANGWLISHQLEYKKYMSQLNQINTYLFVCKSNEEPISRKERSFSIFGEEKILDDGGIRTMLSHLDLDEQKLAFYDTPEYCLNDFIPERRADMTLLICENKDISEAKEGQIVVALVENENTLKRFYKDEENQCIRLHPENKKMTDIIVPNCKIQGVAVKVIKSLE